MGKNLLRTILLICLAISASQSLAFVPSGLLEIHYVNVGWGTSVLVIGPDGTRMLMDGGRDNMGNSRVIPYMESMGLLPADGLTYIISSHLHSDHLAGLTEVMNGGYDVTGGVYYNGSNLSNGYVTAFMTAASRTSSGPARILTLGSVIQLGGGATVTCVCANGYVIGHGYVSGSHDDENDRAIGLLFQYGAFEYLFAGDLGGGEGDYNCTNRITSQVNVETNLAQALMPGGEHPLLTSSGVEVIHVNHHASESSTNSDYMNLLTPAVACIAVGSGQAPDYMFPRHDVVDNVLLGDGYCITAPAAIVLQNEEGYPAGSQTSYSGYCVGNIIITTSGVANYTINGDGQVTEGPDERSAAGLPLTIPFDGFPPDIVPPTIAVTSPNGGEQWAGGSWHNITWSAYDTVGVESYAIDYSTDAGGSWIGAQGQTAGNPQIFGWTLPQTTSSNCLVRLSARDAAGNTATDNSDAVFSIITAVDTIPPIVSLVAPNGGETWYSSEVDTIQWQASDNIGIASYSLSYSTNSGTSWQTIQTRTPGDPGYYPWTVPNVFSNNCRVKVVVWDDLQNQAVDSSDATFRITYRDNQGPTVDIILPLGGEIWTVGSSRYVFWSASDTSGVDSVSLQYSVDSGTSWRFIFPYEHYNPGYYLWTIPDARSRQAMVRAVAKDAYGNIGYGVSDGIFTIRKSPVIDRSVKPSLLAR